MKKSLKVIRYILSLLLVTVLSQNITSEINVFQDFGIYHDCVEYTISNYDPNQLSAYTTTVDNMTVYLRSQTIVRYDYKNKTEYWYNFNSDKKKVEEYVVRYTLITPTIFRREAKHYSVRNGKKELNYETVDIAKYNSQENLEEVICYRDSKIVSRTVYSSDPENMGRENIKEIILYNDDSRVELREVYSYDSQNRISVIKRYDAEYNPAPYFNGSVTTRYYYDNENRISYIEDFDENDTFLWKFQYTYPDRYTKIICTLDKQGREREQFMSSFSKTIDISNEKGDVVEEKYFLLSGELCFYKTYSYVYNE